MSKSYVANAVLYMPQSLHLHILKFVYFASDCLCNQLVIVRFKILNSIFRKLPSKLQESYNWNTMESKKVTAGKVFVEFVSCFSSSTSLT